MSDLRPSSAYSVIKDTNKLKVKVDEWTGIERVNEYELRVKIGSGAYGVVYKARSIFNPEVVLGFVLLSS
jgi:serine/threonine protein kinase